MGGVGWGWGGVNGLSVGLSAFPSHFYFSASAWALSQRGSGKKKRRLQRGCEQVVLKET